MPLTSDWTEFFFYPVLPSSCPICAIPSVDRNICCSCRGLNLQGQIRSAAFLSYTWGRSASPACAFKNREKFEPQWRNKITDLFGWMAHAQLTHLSDSAVVVGVPPRRTIKWGLQDHLADLLCAMEQVNVRVLRDALAFESGRLVVVNAAAAATIRDAPIIVVDNLLNTRGTVSNISNKLTELNASEVHCAS
jgi:hypothetical protein